MVYGKGKINQCVFWGGQHSLEDANVVFMCGQRTTNLCPFVGDVS